MTRVKRRYVCEHCGTVYADLSEWGSHVGGCGFRKKTQLTQLTQYTQNTQSGNGHNEKRSRAPVEKGRDEDKDNASLKRRRDEDSGEGQGEPHNPPPLQVVLSARVLAPGEEPRIPDQELACVGAWACQGLTPDMRSGNPNTPGPSVQTEARWNNTVETTTTETAAADHADRNQSRQPTQTPTPRHTAPGWLSKNEAPGQGAEDTRSPTPPRPRSGNQEVEDQRAESSPAGTERHRPAPPPSGTPKPQG